MGEQKKAVRRVVIADDHAIFRQGLVKQIESDHSYQIVKEVADGSKALEAIYELEPHIAVLDVNMPEMNGLEVAMEVNGKQLPTDLIILTMYKEREYFNKAMDLGVKGYLLKDNTFEDLMACLESVAQGRPFISPLLSEYMVSRLKKMGGLEKEAFTLEHLTPAEKRVIRLIAECKTSREIADELNLSPRTVENHRANICSKLEIKGVNKLLQFALEHKSLLW